MRTTTIHDFRVTLFLCKSPKGLDNEIYTNKYGQLNLGLTTAKNLNFFRLFLFKARFDTLNTMIYEFLLTKPKKNIWVFPKMAFLCYCRLLKILNSCKIDHEILRKLSGLLPVGIGNMSGDDSAMASILYSIHWISRT